VRNPPGLLDSTSTFLEGSLRHCRCLYRLPVVQDFELGDPLLVVLHNGGWVDLAGDVHESVHRIGTAQEKHI